MLVNKWVTYHLALATQWRQCSTDFCIDYVDQLYYYYIDNDNDDDIWHFSFIGDVNERSSTCLFVSLLIARGAWLILPKLNRIDKSSFNFGCWKNKTWNIVTKPTWIFLIRGNWHDNWFNFFIGLVSCSLLVVGRLFFFSFCFDSV